MTDTLPATTPPAPRTPIVRTKLIEVALPLDAINAASAREKSIRHGHPSTLHLWWARRPLAACRAVLFAQLVDDPSAVPEEFPTAADQERERRRLFAVIEELVKWENSTNQTVLDAAQREIARSVARAAGLPLPLTPHGVRRLLAEHAPPVLDPFCGGGSIPLEAQRLGLEAHGSDLNPVAVLITKALIEIPPKFAGQLPVNPADRARQSAGVAWPGATGLAADVRYYGKWMRDEAWKRIGHLYPKVKLPTGGEATVIAWLWARTVRCPNPACGAQMPLVSSLVVSKKAGRNTWVEPIVDHENKTVRFEVRTGGNTPPAPPKVGRGAKFRCLVCEQVAPEQHIKAEGAAGRMGAQRMATVAEGNGRRVYLSPTAAHAATTESVRPNWAPEQPLANDPRNLWCIPYGLTTFADLFTPRQLVALTTFSDLVGEARVRVLADGGEQAYADAVATYLGIVVSKASVFHNSLARWRSGEDKSAQAFGRQAIPMVWDFAEVNPFAGAGGDFEGVVTGAMKAVGDTPAMPSSKASQVDATIAIEHVECPLVCTDPPYYDNIGYADLSDFFYVWLRHSLGMIYPDLFRTLLTPKAHELIASPYRFDGSRERADEFFEKGLTKTFANLRSVQRTDYPLTVFYAFKQAETEEDETSVQVDVLPAVSTGWETMLEGLIRGGFRVSGTWPVRTEMTTRMVGRGTNALASSIVLVCRPRPADAPLATRREFIAALRRELPEALRTLQHGNVAPVDFAQASIGPGMAVFSRYGKVLEADGASMPVRAALQLINQELDAYLAAQEGEMDPDTRFCVAWFSQYGMAAARFGEADVLARSGVLEARAGSVRLLPRRELDPRWDPRSDQRVIDWECAQQLISALDRGGEAEAAQLVRRLGAGKAQIARDLAYRLYSICERKGWAEEALAYNGLVASWPGIQQKAAAAGDEYGREPML